MTDVATTARLMNVAEAAIEEFERQGAAEVLPTWTSPRGTGASGH
jgi:hypothetical protein